MFNVEKFIKYNEKYYHGSEVIKVEHEEGSIIAWVYLVNHFIKRYWKLGYLLTADGGFIVQTGEDLEYSEKDFI